VTEDLIGVYPITISIIAKDFDLSTSTIDFIFNFELLELNTNVAPQWSGSIADQSVIVGESLLVILPGYFDMNVDDEFTFTLEAGDAASFTEFDTEALTLTF